MTTGITDPETTEPRVITKDLRAIFLSSVIASLLVLLGSII
jgi:hypothetical protein